VRKDVDVTRWLIWSIFIVAWTIALELPVPHTESLPGGDIILSRKKLIAKTAHVAAYALLTALSAWVPMPARYRWVMMFLVMAHATGTELLQDALHEYCGRGGELYDVGFDQLGIILGAAASWKWWTRPDPPLDRGA
jgi:VanZ family protein